MHLGGDDQVCGQHEAGSLAARLGHDPFGIVQLVRLHQALAEGVAPGRQEGVGHAASDEDRLAAGQQRLDHLELPADLGPADDGVERPARPIEQRGQGGHLPLEQETGHARQEVGDPLGRGVRAMGGTKGIVDVQVGHVGQRLGESRVVRLLLRVEAQVLEEQQVPGAQLVDRHLHARPERVTGHPHRAPQQGGEAISNRLEAQGVVHLALRPPKVAGQDHGSPMLKQVDQRRQAGPDASVIGDAPVVERHVEVGTQEDALAEHVDIPDRQLVHGPAGRRHGPARAALPCSSPGLRPCSCIPIRCRTTRSP